MKRLPVRALFTLLLGVFVALGVSLSAVQASDMAVKMAVSLDMDGDGQGCDACPGGGDTGAADCVNGCIVAAFALLPAISDVKMVLAPDLPVAAQPAAHDTFSPPDPYPPRTSELG